MASPDSVARIESLTWVAIYAGLFAIVIGFAIRDVQPAAAAGFWVLGGLAVAAGALMVWIRSRMQPGATDTPKKN